MEGYIASHKIRAVRKPSREAAGFRKEQQTRGLDGPAGEEEEISFLFDEIAVAVLVDRGLDLA